MLNRLSTKLSPYVTKRYQSIAAVKHVLPSSRLLTSARCPGVCTSKRQLSISLMLACRSRLRTAGTVEQQHVQLALSGDTQSFVQQIEGWLLVLREIISPASRHVLYELEGMLRTMRSQLRTKNRAWSRARQAYICFKWIDTPLDVIQKGMIASNYNIVRSNLAN